MDGRRLTCSGQASKANAVFEVVLNQAIQKDGSNCEQSEIFEGLRDSSAALGTNIVLGKGTLVSHTNVSDKERGCCFSVSSAIQYDHKEPIAQEPRKYEWKRMSVVPVRGGERVRTRRFLS